MPTPHRTMRKNIKILIVEDSPTQVAHLTYLLEEEGYAVATATNGREALASVRAKKPTLVISDIMMPEMDGYTLCRTIKSDAALKAIPVILVTDLNSPQDVVMGLQCCADNFITKPYDPQFLLARITQSLRNRELRANIDPQAPIMIDLAGQQYVITAERHQILDLLIPTYEEAVRLNQKLREHQEELAQQVQERTADNERLLDEMDERKRAEDGLRSKTEQLATVTDAMTAFLESGDFREASTQLVHGALRQTKSEYGFVGVVAEGPILRILAHQGIVWSETVNREFYESALRTYQEIGYLEFTNFNNLFGRVITSGKPVLSNDPSTDPRSGGLPPGHPPLLHFLGVPIHKGTDVVGMIGVANCPGGYTGQEQAKIEILSRTASVLYDSYRRREREIALETQRKQAEERLAQRARDLARANTELESFNRLAVGREQRMIDLKRQVNQLLQEAGKPPAYNVSFAPEDPQPSEERPHVK